MAEYIEKKAVLDAIWQGCGACAEEVEQLPVVEIVRCRECRHFHYFEQLEKHFCILDGRMCEAEPVDFCSRGEQSNE